MTTYKINKKRLDATTVPEIEKELFAIDDKEVVVDLQEVQILTSIALAMFLKKKKRGYGCNITLVNVSPTILEIIKTTGFESFLEIK